MSGLARRCNLGSDHIVEQHAEHAKRVHLKVRGGEGILAPLVATLSLASPGRHGLALLAL
jgi:hypothetical protein